MLFNDIFVKYFEKHGAHLIRQHRKFPSSIPTRGSTCQLKKKKKKKAHILTHNYVFSHIKTCYLKYGTKHIFCLMIFTTLFKPQFSHYFKQQYRNLQPNGP